MDSKSDNKQTTQLDSVDQCIATLNDEFKIIQLATSSEIDLFLRIWCSFSKKSEEQRFIAIMDRVCFRYLENEPNLLEEVKVIDLDKIRENRKKIIKQLYCYDIAEFKDIVGLIKKQWIQLLKTVKALHGETSFSLWSMNFCNYINAFINRDKIDTFEEKYNTLAAYVNRIRTEMENSSSKYEHVHPVLDNLCVLALNIYNLFENMLTTTESIFLNFRVRNINNKLDILLGFFNMSSMFPGEMDIPDIFQNNVSPLILGNKYIAIVSDCDVDSILS